MADQSVHERIKQARAALAEESAFIHLDNVSTATHAATHRMIPVTHNRTSHAMALAYNLLADLDQAEAERQRQRQHAEEAARCAGCGVEIGEAHASDCPALAAGGNWKDRPKPDIDASAFVEIPLKEEWPGPVIGRGGGRYEAHQDQLNAIEFVLLGAASGEAVREAQQALDEIRGAPLTGFPEVPEPNPLEAPMKEALGRIDMAERRAAFLDRVAAVMIERQAAELVARGFMNLAQAQQWANTERAKVAADLHAIEQGAAS